jgi:hypothetical protein
MNLDIIYSNICERGQIRILDKSIYTEKHHIVPVCMGGDNKKDNLTKLTAKEHFICHKILCKLYPDNEKLRYAFWAMCNQKVNRDYIVSSRDYEYAKVLCLEMWKRPKSKNTINKINETKKYNKILRQLKGEKINREQGGDLNHNHGKKWITNISTNESKMIIGDVPDGWKLGRVKVGSLGKSNSKGKRWYHDPETGSEKYFSGYAPVNWISGRSKNIKLGGDNLSGKVCYFNTSLNKERYFSDGDIIPNGWVKGKLKSRVWFYNPELNAEKLFDLDSVEFGFIRGRLPKLPFNEEIKDSNESIRIFKSDIDEESLMWHRDREDRIIESIGDTDWKIQIDNELPKVIDKAFIPMGVYHRVIKGTGDLKIKLIKNPS